MATAPTPRFRPLRGNPYFIDLDLLAADGLLRKQEYNNIDWSGTPDKIDYGRMYALRYPVLRKACDRLLAAPPAGYAEFCSENAFWLPDYALFMALKDAHGGAPWSEWEPALIRREAEAMEDARRAYAADIEFWKAVQYLFFKQWLALKAYANERGVENHRRSADLCSGRQRRCVEQPGRVPAGRYADPRPRSQAARRMRFRPPASCGATRCMTGTAMKKTGYAWWVRPHPPHLPHL